MALENADVIEIENENFIVVDTGIYEGKKYAFLNKLDQNEEPTNDNKIIEIVESSALEVSDEIMKVLLPKFVARTMEKEF